MGLEIDSDSDDPGTLASAPLLDLMQDVDHDTGLVEILRSLARAAEGAADVHEQADHQSVNEDRDPDLADTVARLKRFAAHIEAARKEIW